MISAENLSKSYGGQILLDAVSFQINSRERVGLVGRNGHGKTTLFRMIIGAESPDEGVLKLPKNYRIGHVAQRIAFSEATVLQEGIRGLPEEEKDHHWKVEKVLAGLGFSEADMARPPEVFSGGYQVRLNLAKVLVSEPDLLLLDEPTNYLDITSIRWIERFLTAWPRELMLITHDRGFMDKVVTHTLAIHRRKMRKVAGNTEKLYAQIAQEEEVYEKTRLNDERKRKEIEQFINRFRAKARLANLVQSRVKSLEKMEKKEKLEGLKTLDFSFREKALPGRHVMTTETLRFGYDPARPLITDFSISVGPGERIGVVGKNGKGKTTLLKLLSGTLTPDGGGIRWNPNAARGVFEQTHVEHLVAERTVEEEIRLSHPDVDRQKARNICGVMMFEGESALKKISVLSGGEKSRVMLGKLLVTPVNVLLLDEPTNHLDMDAADELLGALDAFNGVVIMVTHNETFLHALAQRLVVFQRDGISVFNGTYGEFLEKQGWEEEAPAPPGPRKVAPDPVPKGTRKDLRRRRSGIIADRSRALKPIEQRIEKTENRIEAKEKELDRLNAEMQAATQDGDGERIAGLGQSIHACREAIDRLFGDLEAETERLDAQRVQFDKKLMELENQEAG